MGIILSPELERQIRERVEAGLAESVQKFVEGAVRSALTTDNQPQRVERRMSAAELFDEIWGDTPAEALERLPEDGAEQVDHYVYGTPKR